MFLISTPFVSLVHVGPHESVQPVEEVSPSFDQAFMMWQKIDSIVHIQTILFMYNMFCGFYQP